MIPLMTPPRKPTSTGSTRSNRWEKALLRRILDLTSGNQLKASELLGITRTTVKRKMDLHGL